MTRVRALLALAGLAALAACASDDDRFSELNQLRQAVTARAAPGGPPQITRAQIDAAGVALMLATVERRDAVASLIPVGQNGAVTTWTTGDGATLALRGGMVVGTRGLAPDLMSADVPGLAALRGDARVPRTHYDLGPEDRTRRRDYLCRGRDDGPETLDIFGRSYPVSRLTETCAGPGASFTNTYWIGRDGVMRQSRQWLGPDVGFLRLQRLDG